MPTLTRSSTFELIARTIKEERAQVCAMSGHWPDAKLRARVDGIDYTAHALCRALSSTNVNFDRARFLRACGLSS